MKPRHQLYLDDALSERLESLAARPGCSKSAIVSQALWAFLTRDARIEIDATLMARLDKTTETLARIERDQQILLEALALFIRYELTITPPLPMADQAAARAVGLDRFHHFIEQVGRRLATGRSVTRDVLERLPADGAVVPAEAEALP